MAIKLVSIGGGSVTLDIPSTASNLAMTIPASAGTLPYVDSNGILQGVTSGIKFPATQVASSDANVLDDYEEGSWTPILTGSTGTGSCTYSQQSGRYHKVGRMVHCWCYLVASSTHSGTGTLQIEGLPFACSTEVSWWGHSSIGYFGQLNAYGTSSDTLTLLGPQGGNTIVRFHNHNNQNASTSPTPAAIKNTSEFYVGFSYLATA